MKGVGSDIHNEPPPRSAAQAVNCSIQAFNVSFSRTPKLKFVRLEFLLTATQSRFVHLCLFCMASTIHAQVCKSTKDFQLNECFVIRN